MGNVSVSQKTATSISNNFMSLLMESVTECQANSTQTFDMSAQAGGNIDIGSVDVDMKSLQRLDCISNLDVSQILKNFNSQEFESKTKQAVSGLPLGVNTSVDQMTSKIVSNVVSENVIRNIQTQIATAKQQMVIDLQAGGNIKVASVQMTAVVDQAIKGVSDSIVKTIQEQTSETKATSITDQLIDGWMSGSTITKIVFLVVIGGGIITIIVIIIKTMFGSKQDPQDTQQQFMQQYYQPYQQYYQQYQ